MYERVYYARIASCRPRVALAHKNSGNQWYRVSEDGVFTPSGAASTAGITGFVPGLSELLMCGRIYVLIMYI